MTRKLTPTERAESAAREAYSVACNVVHKAEQALGDRRSKERADFEAALARETQDEQDAINKLRALRGEAEVAYNEARFAVGVEKAHASATPPGTRLVEWSTGTGWSYQRHELRPTGRTGIVEVWSHDSEHRDNIRWGLPETGDLIVRVLKKGGGRSRDFAKLDGWRSDWLPEGVSPKKG